MPVPPRQSPMLRAKSIIMLFYDISIFTPHFSGVFYILLHKKRILTVLVMRFPRFFYRQSQFTKAALFD